MSNGNPFAGHPLVGPGATKGIGNIGGIVPDTNDPAWQPPVDPLKQGVSKSNATIIYREIPQVTTQGGWSIADVRAALVSLATGLFDGPAQLVDSVIGDSRVSSALSSRTGGLLGRPISFKIPKKYRKDQKAKDCLDAWQRVWPQMATEPTLSELQRWSSMLGFGIGQLTWDTSEEIWTPYLNVWHPRFCYYHWMQRQYMAMTLDGQTPIIAGNATWVLHAPNGAYRGWMRGALRSIAPWWLARNYALRDWARYSERHGMPIVKAITPAGADPLQIQNYRNQLASLGQESVVAVPTSNDPAIGSYDIAFLEASDQAWQGFQGLIEQCNAEITLSLMGQNLTSEVKEGSFAAARVHADVRQAIIEADARALAQTIYIQIARPFAAINFGDPELAPRTVWDVAPYEDNVAAAQTFSTFATALKTLKDAGHQVTNPIALAKSMGLNLSLGEVEQAVATAAAPAPTL